MKEEIRNSGAELNEAELKNVSGGNSCWIVEGRYCSKCDRKETCGDGCKRLGELDRYIRSYGYPGSYRDCPFYNEA